MPSDSKLKRGFKAEAERLAEKYRIDLGKTSLDPLDALDLAKHLGVHVFSVSDFENSMSNEYIKILKNTSNFSAVWTHNPNNKNEKIILHNNHHSFKRQQSNLMHELAHIIRGHNIPEEVTKLCYQFGLHYYNDEHEEEARYLGGCLQITRKGLLDAVKRKLTHEEISDQYNASIDMVKYRLSTSGVLKQISYYKN